MVDQIHGHFAQIEAMLEQARRQIAKPDPDDITVTDALQMIISAAQAAQDKLRD
jgi:chorismate mutase